MSGDDGTAIACSLEPGAMPERLSHWRAVLDEVVERQALTDGVHLRFRPGRTLAAELGRLVAAEQECCGFFDFELHISAAVIELVVRAPAEAQELVAALFGPDPQTKL
jgi:hypothetical protein